MTDGAASYPLPQIQQFLVESGHANLGEIDFFRATTSSQGRAGLSPEALQTYSRLYKLTLNHDDSDKLLQQGVRSAAHVAMLPERSFVTGPAAKAGLDPKQAHDLHQRATRIHNRTLHLFAATQGAVASPHFRSMRAVNVGDPLTQHFENLSSYQELF